MNNIVLAIILLCSCYIARPDNVETAPKLSVGGKPIEIRVIEGSKIVSHTLEGKDIEADLMKTRNKLDQEIKKIDQEIEKDVADWQGKARLKVDPEKLEKEQAAIMRKKKERDVKAEAAQEEFQRLFNRALQKFNNEMKETVKEVAQKEGWDLVKIRETGEIVYSSPKIDATSKVVTEHDNRYKAKKVAAEAKAKPAQALLPIKAGE